MQIFVRSSDKLRAFSVDENTTFGGLEQQVCTSGLFKFPYESSLLVSSVFHNNTIVTASVPVLGGAKDITQEDKALALDYIKIKICRDCYRRNAILAQVCRSKRCGHSANLRPKKLSGRGAK